LYWTVFRRQESNSKGKNQKWIINKSYNTQERNLDKEFSFLRRNSFLCEHNGGN